MARLEDPSTPSEGARKADSPITAPAVDVRVAELLTGLSRRSAPLMHQLSLQSADGRVNAYPMIEAKAHGATPLLVTGANQLIQVALPGMPEQAAGKPNVRLQQRTIKIMAGLHDSVFGVSFQRLFS